MNPKPIEMVPWLPMQTSFSVCDVKTREEYKIVGDTVDAIEFNNTIYISPVAYEQFLKLLNINPNE